MTKEIKKVLYDEGKDILRSEAFAQAGKQVHHKRTTVRDHTLRVAAASIEIGRTLRRFGINTNEHSIVVGALCHDLGILGRDEKYKNDRECWKKHPYDSELEAEKLVKNLDDRTRKVIRYHMWPLNLHPPVSKEGFIVMMADKYESFRDLFPREKRK